MPRILNRPRGRARPRARVLATLGAWAALALATAGPVGAQSAAPEERVGALKQSLSESQAKLRSYEWVETTAVSLKGEEKSRKQNRCYYGVEGQVQKLPRGTRPASPWTRRPRT